MTHCDKFNCMTDAKSKIGQMDLISELFWFEYIEKNVVRVKNVLVTDFN